MIVVWSDDALAALRDIYNSISLTNSVAASRLVEQVFDTGDSLELFPNRYAEREGGFRQVRVARAQYVIRYEIVEDEAEPFVSILTVRHGARAGE